MQNTVITIISISAMTAISLTSGVGVVRVAQKVLDPAPVRALVINELEYGNGVITQNLGPVPGTVDAIAATWTASIKRGDEIICGPGTGPGVYTSTISVFSPADWTGDSDCPQYLQPGDIATATWEYKRSDDLVVSVTGRIVVGYDQISQESP